jgi:hypothetical protein
MAIRSRILVLIAASACSAGAAGADWTVVAYDGDADFRTRLSMAQEGGSLRPPAAKNEMPGLHAPRRDLSRGFNAVPVNSGYRAGDWTYRFGAGSAVRPLAGAPLLAGGGWRLYVSSDTFISVEALLTIVRANPTLPGPPNGELGVPNTAIHAGLGLGREF